MSGEKGIYHCDKCGICKVGGQETSYHCDGCNCCFKMPMQEDHVCVLNRLDQACSVCLENLQSTRDSICFLKCSHNMHRACLLQYYKTDWKCPICRKSMIDPLLVESQFDEQISGTIMPEEYRNAKVHIYCNDCE